jgi:hypothetical protein
LWGEGGLSLWPDPHPRRTGRSRRQPHGGDLQYAFPPRGPLTGRFRYQKRPVEAG